MTTTPDETPVTEPKVPGWAQGGDMEVPPEGSVELKHFETLIVASLTLAVGARADTAPTPGGQFKSWQVKVITEGNPLIAAKRAVDTVAEDARGWVLDERDKEHS